MATLIFRRMQNKKGTTVVEMAVVLPIFLLLVFGIIDFGYYFFVEHTLQYATREGMRLALVGIQLNDEDGKTLSREDSIKKKIKDNASLAVDPSSLSIYVFPIGSDYSDPLNWQDLPANAGNPGSYMRVKTRYTFKFLTPLISTLFPGGVATIEAQGTYKNELFST
jgi:Flp pilus assembly protein TadG